MTIHKLRCEDACNPLGIDSTNPRLSWQIHSESRGVAQIGYQIQVASSPELLSGPTPDLWNSGRVDSSDSVSIPYEGSPLTSRQRAFWRVSVWDNQGNLSVSAGQDFWEMGLLAQTDWEAQWIGGQTLGGSRTTAPAPFLRRTFCVPQAVSKARIYVTALGLYDLSINGISVGDQVLAPGWTDYRKRVRYQVYDVTSAIQVGENAMGAILGDGWYCGNVEWRGRNLYGDRPLLLAQLELTLDDGSVQRIVSDAAWRYAFGPIIESDLLMGESYDARREFEGWSQGAFDDSKWMGVEVDRPTTNLVAQMSPPIRVTQEILPIADPVERSKWPLPEFIFDMGQNMVGWVRLKVNGPAGTTIRLRFAEVLKPDGGVYLDNLRSAKQTDYYTLRGDKNGEVWEPKFTFHGFRYVEVEGFPSKPTRDSITGIVVHSDVEETGTFECSDPLVTQLQKNIQWGQRGNFVDVPTDCPQRDERLGWTGDAQVFVRTAAFNRDVSTFFEKYETDLSDAQSEKGEIPPIAPNTNVVGPDGGPAWADAFVICPWTIYQMYGNTKILRDHFEGMKRFVDWMESTAKDGIRCYEGYEGFRGFGDWLSTNADTPNEVLGTAFLAYSAHLLSKIATVLGHSPDAEHYMQLFKTTRSAFQQNFLAPAGRLVSQSQTTAVLALHFDLLPEESRAKVAQALVDDIGGRGMHLSTGFVGTPYINHVLTKAGRLDIAYNLLLQKSWPSWLYPVTQGATTIWERWDGWTHDKGFQDVGMNSFNHYAYGAIGEWLYGTVAGICLEPIEAGFGHVRLEPMPGGGLTSARASYDSVRGPIVSDWQIDGNEFRWNVTIPANAIATAIFPFGSLATTTEDGCPVSEAGGVIAAADSFGKTHLNLGSGTYSFSTSIF